MKSCIFYHVVAHLNILWHHNRIKSEKIKMHDFDATNVLSNDKRTDYDYYDKADGYWTDYKDSSKFNKKAVKETDDKLDEDRKPKQKHVNVPADVGKSKVETKYDSTKHHKEESDIGYLSAQDNIRADDFGKPKIKYKPNNKYNVTFGNPRTKRITTARPTTISSTENRSFTAQNGTKPNLTVLESQEESSRTRSENKEKNDLSKYKNITFRVSAGYYDTDKRNTTDIFKLKNMANVTEARTFLTDLMPTQPVYRNKMLGVNDTSVTDSGGPPYVAFLAGSTTVFAVSFIVLLALYFYRRRRKGTSVITDEMYNAYKLNKKMETRSPLPSPRSSEQEGSCEYDFIHPENVGKTQINEIPEASDSSCMKASVYLELEDTPRYDYATPPDPAHSVEVVLLNSESNL